ncbi:uncharacterized protein LOC108596451 [Drosophila busckii]|uniref:uncharacterized protein LOC108596451 n=1 Tax=Drosophila busckii TaxID=30019 RepID=UPI00083EF12F|nr:uncharacterized protein LOC108596451 [Drosophila busckii]
MNAKNKQQINKAHKLRMQRFVRFGEVLYDEKLNILVLCRGCQRCFPLETFKTHLNKCVNLKHITTSINELQYNEAKRELRLVNNGKHKLHIYEPGAVTAVKSKRSEIDWEAELEDPRWYEDTKKLPAKTKLESPNNAKENVAKTTNAIVKQQQQKIQNNQPKQLLPALPPAKRKRPASPKRTILTNQQQQQRSCSQPANQTLHVPQVIKDLRRLESATRPASAAANVDKAKPKREACIIENIRLSAPSLSAPAVKVNQPNNNNNSNNYNQQQILNKLRACGVEVKRRRHTTTTNEHAAATITKNAEALAIVRKLQAHGIKCTKVKP